MGSGLIFVSSQVFPNLARISRDAIVRNALMGSSIVVVKTLFEEMASNNYHWSNEGATPNRSNRKYDVHAMTLLASSIEV